MPATGAAGTLRRMMAKEIDRVRAQSALAVIKQHPGMVLFAVSPVIIALGLVWWFVSPTLAVLLLIGAVVGGGAVLLMKR
jgi:ABC-type Fe3+ transport system permease subunit